MFRHLGSRRNFLHNLRLAILLCFTAGIVNGAGFLAFMVLTTNVTGHTAMFAVSFIEGDLNTAAVVALWLIVFLAGAFLSSLYINWVGRNKFHAYTLPLLFEVVIMCAVALSGDLYDGSMTMRALFAGSLLFAMGMQNALVSMVSGSVVRTTHLTGIFTDLGIDLALIILPRSTATPDIRKRLFLRVMIIVFFLCGAITGSYTFIRIQYPAFFLPAAVLLVAIFYDYFRVKWTWLWKHKFRKI